MKTAIIQSYRTVNVPNWISRCLASVRAWAERHGFDYEFWDDRIFDLCGADYLSRVGTNVRSITNLARLEAIRDAHRRGYDRAFWFDADVFVFDAQRLRIDLTRRYAFCRDVWLFKRDERILAEPGLNNCVCAFVKGEPDLDLLITVIRHIARHHEITSNYQVGGYVIEGLRPTLRYPTIEPIGMFSAMVVDAIARNIESIVRFQARSYGAPVYAANLAVGPHFDPDATVDVNRAMDVLEETKGDAVNRHLAGAPAPRAKTPSEPTP